jgi:hypothetical protein
MAIRKMPDAAASMLAVLGHDMGTNERLITCGIAGDPGKAGPGFWKPRAYDRWGNKTLGGTYPWGWNAYVTCGVFRASEDGEYRRRANLCIGGAALMVDDVGTKISHDVMRLAPTLRIETSPGNEQWWYVFDKIERNVPKFDALIRAFIAGPLKGKDPGMASITRVGRLPGYRNLKAEYGGFDVRTIGEASGALFDVDALVRAFGLELMGEKRKIEKLVPADYKIRIEDHFVVRRFLRAAGMLKRKNPDLGGWTEISCPWVEGHTGGIDNGAAIREPHEENGFTGAFRCHHGSCTARGWRELTEWAAEEAAEQLALVNARAVQA